MKQRKLLFLQVFFSVLLAGSSAAQAPAPMTKQRYEADFDFLWETVRDNYAYWDVKATDWDKVRTHYRPQLDSVRNKGQFIMLLERLLRELYDHHAGLNTNTAASYRLVPTGADVWAVFRNGKALITAVRAGTGAARSGIQPGMEVLAVNGKALDEALGALTPCCLKTNDPFARDYALQLLLAGTHDRPRELLLRQGEKEATFYPDKDGSMDKHLSGRPLEARLLEGNICYIRINNSLGDEELIPAFDSVLNAMMGTRGLILDLRETPSGGNTLVARGIMGRLISHEGYYQKHELPNESGRWGIRRSWAEIVSPRGVTYSKKVIVLAGPWTGSMGEGITIGLHGLRRARVMGAPMAGLRGAIYSYALPNSAIGFYFPVERLYHMDGTPREQFREMKIVPDVPSGPDAVLEAARRALR
jgi:C-terminal processing protease CtpA/Prc